VLFRSVSVRPVGATNLGTKVEIKNMNSFRNVERATEYEIKRQIEVLKGGGGLVQETRLWDPDREVTRSMRSKEFAHDYRYFPEPDLPPLVVSDEWVEAIQRSLPELPDARRQRFVQEYDVPEYDADVLTMRKDMADYYEEAVRHYRNPKGVSNWVMGDILRIIRERKLDTALVIHDWPVPAQRLAGLVALIDSGEISGKIAKAVFEEMVRTGKTAAQIVAEQGLTQISDEAAIAAAIDAVITANAEKVAEYRRGKEKLFGFFVGQVMKATQGKANPQKLNELLRSKLSGH
jgi:aspartyl-tRNA(Asn)/glutamyl-tRNA(Gln) amidotransferase subunit B